ncbi:type II secretion system protein [Candidatus Saccharibacteria bacterium TM7i]|nr:type II secretion system protein [Candidatus Saccharibacteria bacterium TM7i]
MKQKINNTQHGSRKGFTIIELLIVIVVIAILATITIVAYNGITKQASSSAIAASLDQAAKKVVAEYALKKGVYPATLAEAEVQDTDGIKLQYTVNPFKYAPNFCITAVQGTGAAAKAGHIAGIRTSINEFIPDVPCNGHSGPTAVTAASLKCPTGYVAAPGSSLLNQKSFCVMKYEAKIQGNDDGSTAYNSSFIPESRASGTPWGNITQAQAIERARAACAGCHLISDSEWLTIAYNLMAQPENWYGAAVGSNFMYRGNAVASTIIAASTNDADGYSGTTNDVDQRRTLKFSNGETIWDLAGNVYEWTSRVLNAGDAAPTATGNPMVVRSNTPGLQPYQHFSSFPAFGNKDAMDWGSLQGIGSGVTRIYDNDASRAVLRGGSVGSALDSGIFMAGMGYPPSGIAAPALGFRVTR